MALVLGKPITLVSPAHNPNRRHSLDRRRSWSSLIHSYRWISAVTLKLGAAFLIILLATRWQKMPLREPHHGAYSGEAVYRWHGFHRNG